MHLQNVLLSPCKLLSTEPILAQGGDTPASLGAASCVLHSPACLLMYLLFGTQMWQRDLPIVFHESRASPLMDSASFPYGSCIAMDMKVNRRSGRGQSLCSSEHLMQEVTVVMCLQYIRLVLPCGYVPDFHCEGWRAEFVPFRYVGLEGEGAAERYLELVKSVSHM